jgi:hypothetical protein
VDQAALAAQALEQKRQAEKAKRKAARKKARQMAERAEDEPIYMLPIQREVMQENLDYRIYTEARDEAREQRRLLMLEEEVQEQMNKMGLKYRGIGAPVHMTGEDRFAC